MMTTEEALRIVRDAAAQRDDNPQLREALKTIDALLAQYRLLQRRGSK